MAELISRTPGLRSVLGPLQKLTGLDPAERHALEREALVRRHGREQLDIGRERRTLERLENRERRALERRLRKTERQERTLADEAARRSAREAEQKTEEGRVFDFGDLSESLNERAFGGRKPPAGGEHGGGPDHGHRPDGSGGGRRRRRGHGYRRE